jgi:hypothetical protein
MSQHHQHHDHHHGHAHGHGHDHDNDGFRHHLPPTQLDATLDPTATDGNGHALFGAGNPADGWAIEDHKNFELATDVHYRTGDMAQPTSVEHDGTLDYVMPAGPQGVDPAHNVSTAAANRGATSFDFSFDTGANGSAHPETIQHFLENGGEFIYKIDLDPSRHDNPLVLHAVYDPVHNTGGSHVVWEDSHNQIVIADDSGNAYVTQNSQNLAFYQSLIDVDPYHHGVQTGGISPAGTYDIEAIIIDHHQVVADVHSSILMA